MPIEFLCESCGRKLRVPDGSEGKNCLCPNCTTLLLIPYSVEEFVETRREAPCPNCRHVLSIDEELEGTRGLCPSCKTIFTIRFDSQSPEEIKDDSFAFACPSCQRLFEGNPDMEGRKGKCPDCQAVFIIEKQVVPKKPRSSQRERREKTGQPSHSSRPSASPLSDVSSSSQASRVEPQPPSKTQSVPIVPATKPKSVGAPASVPTSHPIPSQVVSPSPATGDQWLSDIPPPSLTMQSGGRNGNAKASINPYASSVNFATGSPSSSAEAIRRQHLTHEAYAKSYGCLFIVGAVFAGLATFGAVLGIFGSMFSSDRRVMFGAFIILGIVVLIYGLMTLALAAVGIGLRKLNGVGRIGGTIFAVLAFIGAFFQLAAFLISIQDEANALMLVPIPITFLLYGYLLYLLWSPKGSMIFSQRYARVVQDTPDIHYRTPIPVWIFLGLFLLFLVVYAAWLGMRSHP